MINPNENGLIKCPNCMREYMPVLKRKTNDSIQNEYPNASKEEREQLISGICSDKCWEEFLGYYAEEVAEE